MIIDYLNAPAGAGKTYAIVQEATNLAQAGEKVLIVQPTKDLIRETRKDLVSNASFVTPEPFVRTKKRSATDAALQYFQKPYPDGQVAFMAHAGFDRLPKFPRREDWHVFYDEAPTGYWSKEHTLKETHGNLTECLSAAPSPHDGYLRLKEKEQGALRRLADRGKKDDALLIFLYLIQNLEASHWDCFTLEEHWKALGTWGASGSLHVFANLRPTLFRGFKSVTIAGANLLDTEFFRLNEGQGIEFRKHERLSKELLYHQHENGPLTTIYYGVKANWSKSLRDKEDVGPQMIDASLKAVGSQPFLWIDNKDQLDSQFAGHDGKRLPGMPHGQNNYQDRHAVIALMAANQTPSAAKFLEYCGLDREHQRRAIFYQNTYQAVFRCSLRNPKDLTPKIVFVPDEGVALYLQEKLPGATIEQIPISVPSGRRPGRPRIYENEKESRQVSRAKKTKENLINVHKELQEELKDKNRKSEIYCDKNTYSNGNIVMRFFGSIWARKSTNEIIGICDYESFDEFSVFLRLCSQRPIKSKDDNSLITPACFRKVEGADTIRGAANVYYSNIILLDFEHGDLTPADFSKIYPGLRFIAYNTASHKSANLRYRICIPLAEPVSGSIYKVLTKWMLSDLITAGFTQKKRSDENPEQKAHGLDESKLGAQSLFYLPCLPKEDGKEGFFQHYKGGGREPLNPTSWLEVRTQKPPEKRAARSKAFDTGSVDEAALRKAIAEFEAHGVLPGRGNAGTTKLYFDALKGGVRGAAHNDLMREKIALTQSPKDREGQLGRLRRGA